MRLPSTTTVTTSDGLTVFGESVTFTATVSATPPGTGTPAGSVRASANMPMPGMVMSGGLQVTPTGVPGRYAATAEFGMAGAWQMAIEWNGPAGQGSVNFQGGVQ